MNANVNGHSLLRSLLAASVWLVLAAAGPRAASAPTVRARPVSDERFPLGAVLVAHRGGLTYFATGKALVVRGPHIQLSVSLPIPGDAPQSMTFSPDGRRLLLQFVADVRVLRASDLHALRSVTRQTGCFAWWEGERLGYLDTDTGVIHTGGRRRSARVGRDEMVAADSGGRFFLSVRQVWPGTTRNAETPTNLLQLWERTASGHLRLVHRIMTTGFDRAEGDPCHLVVLDPHTVVFGHPMGGGAWLDSVCALFHGHVTAGVASTEYALRFGEQSPLVTTDAIIGLGSAWERPGKPFETKYLYRVTANGLTLRRMPSNVALVTWDPSCGGLGVGMTERGGVTVRYGDFDSLTKPPGKRGDKTKWRMTTRSGRRRSHRPP